MALAPYDRSDSTLSKAGEPSMTSAALWASSSQFVQVFDEVVENASNGRMLADDQTEVAGRRVLEPAGRHDAANLRQEMVGNVPPVLALWFSCTAWMRCRQRWKPTASPLRQGD